MSKGSAVPAAARPVPARRLQHGRSRQPHGIGETAVDRWLERGGLHPRPCPDRAGGVGALVLPEFPLPRHHPQRVGRARLQRQVHVALRCCLLEAHVQARILGRPVPHRVVQHDSTAGVGAQQRARQQCGQPPEVAASQRPRPHQQPGLGQDPPQQGQVHVDVRGGRHGQQDRLLRAGTGGGETEGGGGRDGAVHAVVCGPAAGQGLLPLVQHAGHRDGWICTVQCVHNREFPGRTGQGGGPRHHLAGPPRPPARRLRRRHLRGQCFVELHQGGSHAGEGLVPLVRVRRGVQRGRGVGRGQHRHDDGVGVAATDRRESPQCRHQVVVEDVGYRWALRQVRAGDLRAAAEVPGQSPPQGAGAQRRIVEPHRRRPAARRPALWPRRTAGRNAAAARRSRRWARSTAYSG